MNLFLSKKMIGILSLLIIAAVLTVLALPNDKVDFNTQVKPILNKNCITCHGGVKQKAVFSLLFREEALGKTIQYYLLNPPETNGALENNLRDPFNYKMEDELVHVYTQCMEKMKKIILGAQIKLLNYHPYPHPKAPNLKADHRGR